MAFNQQIQNYLSNKDTPNPGQPATGLQRLQDRTKRPIVCAVCGSEWFFEATLHQYADLYSASAGGDLMILDNTNPTIRMCVCGQPYSPNIGGVRGGRTANVETSGYMNAIEQAKAARTQVFEQISSFAGALEDKFQTLAKAMDEKMAAVEASTQDTLAEIHSALAAVQSLLKASQVKENEAPAPDTKEPVTHRSPVRSPKEPK